LGKKPSENADSSLLLLLPAWADSQHGFFLAGFHYDCTLELFPFECMYVSTVQL
jgi:hypothetical protein